MKKTTKTSKPAKTTKTAKASSKKMAAAPQEAPAKQPGECNAGGAHEWKEEDGEKFCAKCKEPAEGKKPAKGKRTAKAAKPKAEGKMSAIDAAAKVLGETKAPMTTGEMIVAMAEKGY